MSFSARHVKDMVCCPAEELAVLQGLDAAFSRYDDVARSEEDIVSQMRLVSFSPIYRGTWWMPRSCRERKLVNGPRTTSQKPKTNEWRCFCSSQP